MSAAKDSVHPLVRPVWMAWINRRVAKNLDKWGVQDFETLGLAVAEEAGELAQAILQARYENGERGRIGEEAIDLAALCVQVLVSALFAEESNARLEADVRCGLVHCSAVTSNRKDFVPFLQQLTPSQRAEFRRGMAALRRRSRRRMSGKVDR